MAKFGDSLLFSVVVLSSLKLVCSKLQSNTIAQSIKGKAVHELESFVIVHHFPLGQSTHLHNVYTAVQGAIQMLICSNLLALPKQIDSDAAISLQLKCQRDDYAKPLTCLFISESIKQRSRYPLCDNAFEARVWKIFWNGCCQAQDEVSLCQYIRQTPAPRALSLLYNGLPTY